MANINDNMRAGFVQSKNSMELFLVGMEMSTFLQKTDFRVSEDNETAKKLVKDWRRALKNVRIIHQESGFRHKQVKLIAELISISGEMVLSLDINNRLFRRWHNLLYEYVTTD